MSTTAIEKSWPSVPPQLFTANGTAQGVVTVADSTGFKVKQQIVISATGLPDLTVKIMKFISPTQFYVGPTNPTAGQGLTGRVDLSLYTVLLGAFAYAQEQQKAKLTADDIIQAVYRQEPGTTIGVEIDDQWGNPINEANPLPVTFDGTIAIGDVSIVEGGNTMTVNPNGSIDVNIEALSAFQTSQYTVGLSAVQITPTPMPNRNSIGFKAIATGSNAIYVGNSSAVTTSTGYPLFNGDTLEMDLEAGETIYAIATAVGQTLCVVELGD